MKKKPVLNTVPRSKPILIGTLKDFPKDCLLSGFCGTDYADALLQADEWVALVKKNLNVTLVPISYFEQAHNGNSILMHLEVSGVGK
jgi:hypothetical protein